MALQLFASSYLTIDIGFRYIKIIQVKKKKNGDLYVSNYGIGDTPKDCIKNGAIKDKDKVVAEIKKVLSEKKLDSKEAKIVVSGTNIITRIIMMDMMSDGEIDAKMKNEISTYLPINMDEYVVDYKILGVVTEEGTQKKKVFITAVNKKIINSYIEILKDLHLKPISVDIPANSVAKFFQKDIVIKELESSVIKRTPKVVSNTAAVLDFGSETTIINIMKDKIPEFNRVLLVGSSNIDQAIRNELNLLPSEMDKAERYKKMYGLAKYKDQNNELEWQCSEAAKSVIDDILKNVKMNFDFYVNRCAGEPVSKIYIVGGGSQLKGLKGYIEDIFGVPVYQISNVEINGIEFQAGLDRDKVSFLINAIGVAL
ncbi:MAG: type IV pilus assembly protein PilM [Clostridia bacterium]|nr:type IV pilus assembly protein PilM [Clostridia bacterium]